jgi:outer membrane protein TolC
MRQRLAAKEFFISLAQLKKLRDLGKQALEFETDILAVAARRLQVGMGTHHDMTTAQNEQTLAKINVTRAELSFKQMAEQGCLLIRRRCDQVEWDFSHLDARDPSQDVDAQQNVLAQQALVYERERAVLANGANPQVSVGGMLMRNDGGMEMYSAMVGFSLPLFSTQYRRSGESELAVKKSKNDIEAKWHQEQKNLAVKLSGERQTLYRSDLETLKSNILPKVSGHVTTLVKEYSVGKTTFEAVIVGKRQYLDMQRMIINLENELARETLRGESAALGIHVDPNDFQPLPSLSLGGMTSDAAMGPAAGNGMRDMRPGTSKPKAPMKPLDDGAPDEMGPSNASGMGGM